MGHHGVPNYCQTSFLSFFAQSSAAATRQEENYRNGREENRIIGSSKAVKAGGIPHLPKEGRCGAPGTEDTEIGKEQARNAGGSPGLASRTRGTVYNRVGVVKRHVDL